MFYRKGDAGTDVFLWILRKHLFLLNTSDLCFWILLRKLESSWSKFLILYLWRSYHFLLALIPHPVTLAEHKEKERRRKNEQKGKERQKQEDKSQTIKKQNGILKGSKCYCLSHLRASKIQRFFLLVFLSPCFERYFASPGTNTVHILTPDFQPEVSNFVWTCTAVYYLYNYCLLLLVFSVFFLFVSSGHKTSERKKYELLYQI